MDEIEYENYEGATGGVEMIAPEVAALHIITVWQG